MAEHEPLNAKRTATVVLPHDYLSWKLAGEATEFTTDRGDASGTGYWSPREGKYRQDLIALALGHELQVQRGAAPAMPGAVARAGAAA